MNSSTASQRPPRLALALGAGGIRGWAHVGVLNVLYEAAVPVDLIVGASAGALVGALYAARRDPADAQRVALSFSLADFVDWFVRDLRISPRGGRMGRALWDAYGRLDFSEMAVPFAAVALDLADGRQAVLNRRSVGRAVEASIRPPVLGAPIEIDGRFLVDGGLQNPVPVAAARGLGAGPVVSVHVGHFIVLPEQLRPLSARVGRFCRAHARSPDGVLGQCAFLGDLLSRRREEHAPADLEVRPDMRGVSSVWPSDIREAVRRGEAAARAALPAVQRLLASPTP